MLPDYNKIKYKKKFFKIEIKKMLKKNFKITNGFPMAIKVYPKITYNKDLLIKHLTKTPITIKNNPVSMPFLIPT